MALFLCTSLNGSEDALLIMRYVRNEGLHNSDVVDIHF